MNFPVYAASPRCADPSIDQAIYHKPWSHIQKLLDTGVARQISMFDKTDGVQLVRSAPTARQVEDLGLAQAVTILSARGSLIPFASGAQGKLGKPDPINYPIPAVGARNRPLWCHPSILYMEAKAENRRFEAMA
jgi:hypothetical protein